MINNNQKQILSEIYGILHTSIEHYKLYQAFYEESKKPVQTQEEKSLLVLSADAHLQMCYLLWCKVFGGRKQDTHYTNVLCIERGDFISELYKKYGISETEYTKYVLMMIKFRNEYIAHTRDYANIEVPYFDVAKKAILTLDTILAVNNEYGIPFGTLEAYLNATDNKYNYYVKKISL